MRYSSLLGLTTVEHQTIPYHQIEPKINPKKSRWRRSRHKKVKLPLPEIFALWLPYCYTRILEQIKNVVPLAMYLLMFQIFILRQPINNAFSLTLGLVAVIIGLAIFMEGLHKGLMPFSTRIGDHLPQKVNILVVFIIIGILGVGVTFAEPAIGALQAFGASLDINKVPYLYEMLNNRVLLLVIFVGCGVGIAAILGTMRLIYGWSLKTMIYPTVGIVMALSIYVWWQPDLRSVLGLAWDCGAVTTGPVTVPLVLALGIGLSNATQHDGQSSLSGFGIVTMASLLPIIAVLLMAIWLSFTMTPEQIIAQASVHKSIALAPSLWSTTPFNEIIMGLRAIIPLVLFLLFVLLVIIRSTLVDRIETIYGLVLLAIGMCIFNIGLSYGLGAIGTQVGNNLSAAFMESSSLQQSPIYTASVGLFLVILFAFILGFGATIAEPALNALGHTVQNLTNGAFKKTMLMYSVAVGVAIGMSLGIVKLIFNFNLLALLLPLYMLGVGFTIFSSEEFVNVAWDSAGVTTGPVTVPLVLAMGLGLGDAISLLEGFGILSLASICPIISVLFMGLYIQFKEKLSANIESHMHLVTQR